MANFSGFSDGYLGTIRSVTATDAKPTILETVIQFYIKSFIIQKILLLYKRYILKPIIPYY